MRLGYGVLTQTYEIYARPLTGGQAGGSAALRLATPGGNSERQRLKFYPPAVAPTIRKGSSPFKTASGNIASAGSNDKSPLHGETGGATDAAHAALRPFGDTAETPFQPLGNELLLRR